MCFLAIPAHAVLTPYVWCTPPPLPLLSTSIQGLGCTIILDSRKTSWSVTKTTLKSIQLTFVEHVWQVLVLKPKSFWNRQRVGMGLTLKKAKYNFSVSAGWVKGRMCPPSPLSGLFSNPPPPSPPSGSCVSDELPTSDICMGA